MVKMVNMVIFNIDHGQTPTPQITLKKTITANVHIVKTKGSRTQIGCVLDQR
jgi:hypothetical protein